MNSCVLGTHGASMLRSANLSLHCAAGLLSNLVRRCRGRLGECAVLVCEMFLLLGEQVQLLWCTWEFFTFNGAITPGAVRGVNLLMWQVGVHPANSAS